MYMLTFLWTRFKGQKRVCYHWTRQSQIQDFPKEGARFRVKCHVDAIQWGGVVAEFFRDLKNPMRFSGGEGFSVISKNLCDSVGGGSSRNFS